jgi:UPF0042 nucleotide-binding protein
MQVLCASFGHKYNAPEADLVLSAEKLPSPPKTIRDKYNGTHSKLQNDFFQDDEVKKFYASALEQAIKLIEEAKKDGKSELVIAIGCEEGIHRSVALIERLAADISKHDNDLDVQTLHRDIEHKQQIKKKQKEYDQRRKEKRGTNFDDE